MTKANTNFKQGFTIIEVVLVLAIAGLIFLMVFVALPNLQRSQRDTQRRDDYAALAAGITNYLSSHGGKFPITVNAKDLINADGKDPSGFDYALNISNVTSGQTVNALNAGTNTAASTVVVYTHAKCDNNGEKPEYSASSRAFAIYGQLESGTYCSSN